LKKRKHEKKVSRVSKKKTIPKVELRGGGRVGVKFLVSRKKSKRKNHLGEALVPSKKKEP